MQALDTQAAKLPRLSPAPRRVPLGLRLELLSGRNVCLGVGLFSVFLGLLTYVIRSETSRDLRLSSRAREAAGQVTGIERGDEGPNRFDYRFTLPDGKVLEGYSYSIASGPSRRNVTIEYLPERPEVSRIKGMTASQSPFLVPLIVGFFTLIGLVVLVASIAGGLRCIRLLREGELAWGMIRSVQVKMGEDEPDADVPFEQFQREWLRQYVPAAAVASDTGWTESEEGSHPLPRHPLRDVSRIIMVMSGLFILLGGLWFFLFLATDLNPMIVVLAGPVVIGVVIFLVAVRMLRRISAGNQAHWWARMPELSCEFTFSAGGQAVQGEDGTVLSRDMIETGQVRVLYDPAAPARAWLVDDQRVQVEVSPAGDWDFEYRAWPMLRLALAAGFLTAAPLIGWVIAQRV